MNASRLTLFVPSRRLLAVASALLAFGGPPIGGGPGGRCLRAVPPGRTPGPEGAARWSRVLFSEVSFQAVVQTYGWAFLWYRAVTTRPGKYAYYAASLPLPNGATIPSSLAYYFYQCGAQTCITLFRCLLEDPAAKSWAWSPVGLYGELSYAEDLTITIRCRSAELLI